MLPLTELISPSLLVWFCIVNLERSMYNQYYVMQMFVHVSLFIHIRCYLSYDQILSWILQLGQKSYKHCICFVFYS